MFERLNSKYSNDHMKVNYRRYNVCDICATINNKENEMCIHCGSRELTPMSEYEAMLLGLKPESR